MKIRVRVQNGLIDDQKFVIKHWQFSMKHWQVRQKRNCKIKGAARQENIVDYYCMNYLFKSSHKVAQSYILFMLRKKKYFCQLFTCLCLFSRLSICLFMYMQKKEFASTQGLSKAKNWLDHLLLMMSNRVTMETDLHILSYSKKLKNPSEKGLATTTVPLVRPRVKLKKNVCWFQCVSH